jgi:hypothetical protein
MKRLIFSLFFVCALLFSNYAHAMVVIVDGRNIISTQTVNGVAYSLVVDRDSSDTQGWTISVIANLANSAAMSMVATHYCGGFGMPAGYTSAAQFSQAIVADINSQLAAYFAKQNATVPPALTATFQAQMEAIMGAYQMTIINGNSLQIG